MAIATTFDGYRNIVSTFVGSFHVVVAPVGPNVLVVVVVIVARGT